MGIDVKRARRALKSAGARGAGLYFLVCPVGRDKRLWAMLRRRRAVLEAKSNVVDLLFRNQRAIAELSLGSLDEVRRALQEPEKRRLIMTVAASRALLEEELRSHYKSEVGRALDLALSELVAEGVLLQVPGKTVLANQDIYLAVHRKGQPRYDTAELDRLLREGRRYGDELRARARSERATDATRSYRL